MARQIFINLPIKDLSKSKEFFTKLGFTFNPQFTNEHGACMIIEDGHIYSMLVVEDLYKTFIEKEIADAAKTSEVILSLTCENKEEVDSMMNIALSAGATEPKPTNDMGWMYQRGFQDLDGHLREVFFLDATQMPQQV